MKNPLPARLRDAWQRMAARERRLVTAALLLVTVVIAHGLLWSPLQKELSRLRDSVPEERTQLAWMRAEAGRLRKSGPRAPAQPAARDAVSTVEQTAAAQGIRTQITHIEAESGSGAQVTFEAVPFNALITWLAELQDRHGLHVDGATLDSHTVSGTVNARIRLRSGGS
ncbi:MAG: type II secretion system protein M [Burkholderiales bacterium]